MAVLKGRVRKFGDDIDTDSITPGPTLHLPMDELKTHAFEPLSGVPKRIFDGGEILPLLKKILEDSIHPT